MFEMLKCRFNGNVKRKKKDSSWLRLEPGFLSLMQTIREKTNKDISDDINITINIYTSEIFSIYRIIYLHIQKMVKQI